MPSRRDALTAIAAVGLAGCTGDPGTGGNPSRTPGRTPDGTPRTDVDTRTDTRNGSPEPSPTDTPTAPSGPAVRWVRDLGGSIRHRPTVHDGTLYVAGGTNANAPPEDREYLRPRAAENLHALDAGTGEQAWRHEARAGVGGRPRLVAGGVHAVVGWSAGTHGADQRLVRIVDGECEWATDPVGGFLTILGSHDGVTFVGTGDDALGLSGETVHAVGRDGTERWSFAHRGDLTPAAVVGPDAYVGTQGGFVVALGS